MHKNRQNSVDSITNICFHVGMDARKMKKYIQLAALDALYANLANADTQTDRVSFMSNGFKLNSTSSQVNENTSMYIYAAFAEFPFVSSNSKPGTAR